MTSNGKTQGSIFEYAVLFHPKPKKVGDDTVTDPSLIIVDVKRVVAQTDNEVAIKAAREIPEEYLDKLEQVEIAIRPF
jgi:hypothetical protein